MDDWRPAEAQLRAALWAAEAHIERREYFAAARALEPVLDTGDELVRGLHHLAAAGYKAQDGEPERARRQLEHAHRRLSTSLDSDEVDVPALIALVEEDMAS